MAVSVGIVAVAKGSIGLRNPPTEGAFTFTWLVVPVMYFTFICEGTDPGLNSVPSFVYFAARV